MPFLFICPVCGNTMARNTTHRFVRCRCKKARVVYQDGSWGWLLAAPPAFQASRNFSDKDMVREFIVPYNSDQDLKRKMYWEALRVRKILGLPLSEQQKKVVKLWEKKCNKSRLT